MERQTYTSKLHGERGREENHKMSVRKSFGNNLVQPFYSKDEVAGPTKMNQQEAVLWGDQSLFFPL